jgi:putative cell wall-binding protein
MRISVRALSCALVASAAAATTLTVASAPAALAFSSPSVATLAAGVGVSFSAGAAGEPAGDVTLAFTDNSGTSVWSAGDHVMFQLWDNTSNAPLSNTSSNTLDSAAFTATPLITATNGVATSAYSVGLNQSGTSSVSDEFTLNFSQDAPKDSNVTSFLVSGISITLGSGVPLGHVVGLKATASNGTPFSGATATKTVTLGSIPSTTVTNSQVATGAPSATGISLGSITVTDVAGAAVTSGDEIDLTLAYGAKFTTAGTVGGALVTAGTPTIVTVTTTSDTVKATAIKTSSAGDKVTLAGAQVTLPSTLGEVYVAVFDKTTAAFLGAVGVATVVNQARLGGSDRYATASQLFDPQFSFATSVVLTSGANYPDALSAGYLARRLNTGVLTTDPGSLPTPTRQELIAHSIATVYLVGGTAAVSQNVLNQVAALHVGNNSTNPLINVVRIAGSDRFATNNLVDIYQTPATSTTAVVATGLNFADALAVGPAIYKTGDPLILTSGASLSASAAATIADLGIKTAIIVGGTSAVSSAVESALAAHGVTVAYRISGADRTQTAADIAQWETSGLPAAGAYAALGSLGFTDPGLVSVARGDNFADALVAGPVAGAEQHVIVLTADPNTVGAGIGQYFAGRAGTVGTVQALGLASAVSAATLNGAAETLTKPLII